MCWARSAGRAGRVGERYEIDTGRVGQSSAAARRDKALPGSTPDPAQPSQADPTLSQAERGAPPATTHALPNATSIDW